MRDKYDVGLVCYSNRNYGNNMTNYALYAYLKEIGLSVLMINTPKDSYFNQEFYFGDGFIDNPYDPADLAERIEEYEYIGYNNICNYFCVGSDQLFRRNFIEGMANTPLLKFVQSNKYKFSYGTSLGNENYEISDDLKTRISYMLSRFQAISVREQAGKNVLNSKLGLNNVEHVVDPVFLIDNHIYKRMADSGSKRILNADRYIGAYFLDLEDDKEEFIHSLSTERGINSVVILDREVDASSNYKGNLNVMINPKVEEWLAMIEHSDIFVTDSFHGMCFALILKKDFYVLFKKGNWRGIDRINELLNDLGLSDRLITVNDNIQVPTQSIDYNNVELILQKKILYSKNWLRMMVDKAEAFTSCASVYDMLICHEYECKDIYKRVNNALCSLRSEIYFLKNGSPITPENCGNEKKRTVVGFGMGACFLRNIEGVNKGIRLSYITDNNSARWGDEYDGIKCIPPKQLVEISNVYVIIFIDDIGASFEVAKQLIQMKIFAFDHVKNYLKDIENY